MVSTKYPYARSVMLALAVACGPSIAVEDDGTGSSAGVSGSEAGAADANPMASCVPPANAVQARVVIGRGTPTLEVLFDGDDAEPLGCGVPLPRCHYEIHRLVPVAELAPGTFSVEAGTLSYQIESCVCCNGEDGGSDETIESWELANGVLELDVADDTCVMGAVLDGSGQRTPFVAARCDE